MDYALPFLRSTPVTHPGMTEQELRTRRLAMKRAAAINILGDRWVMHPHYRPAQHPYHRPSYKESAILKPIIDEARAGGRL